jgi:cell division protein ZapA
MPQVNVTINGRQFRMACEEGEEARLARLAEDLDQRITRLRARFGEIGDTRLTVMAALTVADELAEIRDKVAGLESELSGLKGADAASSEHHKITQAAAAAALNAAAERIELLAKRLNQTIGGPAVPMG